MESSVDRTSNVSLMLESGSDRVTWTFGPLLAGTDATVAARGLTFCVAWDGRAVSIGERLRTCPGAGTPTPRVRFRGSPGRLSGGPTFGPDFPRISDSSPSTRNPYRVPAGSS